MNILTRTAIVSKIIILHSDTLPLRLLMAAGSGITALSLLCFDRDAFDRPAYGPLDQIGPEWVWALAFLLHFLAKSWRLIDHRESRTLSRIINTYGFLLWFMWTLGLTVGLGKIAPSVAILWAVVFGSGWLLFRTGMANSSVSE